MSIKNCSGCGNQPKIQSDELGIQYRFICDNCNKFTRDIISKSSTLSNPHADEETILTLTQLWNNIN